jgi:hypothetical protein
MSGDSGSFCDCGYEIAKKIAESEKYGTVDELVGPNAEINEVCKYADQTADAGEPSTDTPYPVSNTEGGQFKPASARDWDLETTDVGEAVHLTKDEQQVFHNALRKSGTLRVRPCCARTREEERERCARVADEDNPAYSKLDRYTADEIAAAIRRTGDTGGRDE